MQEQVVATKWPKREIGQFDSAKYAPLDFNYELWTPDGVDLTSSKNPRPLLIEIYGGPGSNKIDTRYFSKFSASIFLSSRCRDFEFKTMKPSYLKNGKCPFFANILHL